MYYDDGGGGGKGVATFLYRREWGGGGRDSVGDYTLSRFLFVMANIAVVKIAGHRTWICLVSGVWAVEYMMISTDFFRIVRGATRMNKQYVGPTRNGGSTRRIKHAPCIEIRSSLNILIKLFRWYIFLPQK